MTAQSKSPMSCMLRHETRRSCHKASVVQPSRGHIPCAHMSYHCTGHFQGTNARILNDIGQSHARGKHVS
eukprot:1143878-Pelagomonas_calceolata.AAC.2